MPKTQIENKRPPSSPTPVIQSVKYGGAELGKLEKLETFFGEQRTKFESASAPDMRAAAAWIVNYPWFAEIVGHSWRSTPQRYTAHCSLDQVHIAAASLLGKEAERVKLDGGAIWEYARVCRELFAREPWKHYAADRDLDTWPECLGGSRMGLPADYRKAIRRGEQEMARLASRVDLPQFGDFEVKRAEWADIAASEKRMTRKQIVAEKGLSYSQVCKLAAGAAFGDEADDRTFSSAIIKTYRPHPSKRRDQRLMRVKRIAKTNIRKTLE